MALIDARPALRTSEHTIWECATATRDQFYNAISHALETKNIDALVTRSDKGIYPPWVRLEAWLPTHRPNDAPSDARLRTELEFRVDVKPYHEHQVVISAQARRGARTIAVAERPEFTSNDAIEWAEYTLGLRGRPTNYTPIADLFANLFLALIPFVKGLHSNRVQKTFRNLAPVSLPLLLLILGVGLLGIATLSYDGYPSPGETSNSPLMIISGVLALLVSIALYLRCQKIIAVVDRPTVSPRQLLQVDSWHAVIPDLGSRYEEACKRISNNLSLLSQDGIIAEPERYGFRTPNGYEERERLVITKGQGVAHLHMYRFGNDIFVGWDSYLNWARWVETRPISTRTEIFYSIEYRGLNDGRYIPNQFDLIDLNSLVETIHRRITDEIRSLMKEYEIDQEIDFSIIRGDRDLALDRQRFDRHLKQEREGVDRSKDRRRWRVS